MSRLPAQTKSMSRDARRLCPCSERSTGRFPGTRDQCPDCGRIVYTRADGTCAKHLRPA